MSCDLLDIPWARLDAYSAETEQHRRENTVFVEPQLQNSAPEWNWWYMLKQIDLKTVCESPAPCLSILSLCILTPSLRRACHCWYNAHGSLGRVLGFQRALCMLYR
jgi:hypothetical protein